MQKNDFEQQVQHQLGDFSLVPGDAVWQKVEARVKKEKDRRRILFFWVFAGVVLLGAGTGVWFISNNNDAIKTPTAVKKPNTSSTREEQNLQQHISEEEDIDKKTKSDNVVGDEVSGSTVVLKRVNTTSRNDFDTSKKLIEKSAGNIAETLVANNETKPNPIIDKVDEQTNKSESTNLEATAKLKEQELKESISLTDETVIEKSEVKTIIPPVKDEVVAATKVTNQSKKPLTLGAMVLGGMSNNVSSIPIFTGEKSNERAQFGSPFQGQSSTADMAGNSRYNYSSSFSWGAGLYVQKFFTRRTGVSVGLNYELMSSNITVGARVDSSGTFQDSLLIKTATVPAFYRTGANNEYRNKYHLIQLPVNVLFHLNRNADKPFTLSAGFTGGILIGSNTLYYNGKSKTYYKEKDQFERLTLSAQTALAFTLLNHTKYQIQAGPHIQYQLSNLTKPVVHTNEHLWLLGVKGNLLFKKTK